MTKTQTSIEALREAIDKLDSPALSDFQRIVLFEDVIADARAALEDVEALRKAARAIVALFINARGGCWDVVTIRENSEHHHNLRDAVAKFQVKPEEGDSVDLDGFDEERGRQEPLEPSDEESTMNDAFTRLSEASFAKDWESDEDKVYDHTTAEEREGWLRDDEVYNDPTAVHDIIYRLIADVKAGERHLQSLKDDSGDIICDLEDQVKRLDRQLGDELAADSVLCPHAPNHILEAKCKELEDEAERGCPSCAHCQLKRGGHLA